MTENPERLPRPCAASNRPSSYVWSTTSGRFRCTELRIALGVRFSLLFLSFAIIAGNESDAAEAPPKSPALQPTTSPTAKERMQKILTEWERKKKKNRVSTPTSRRVRKILDEWERGKHKKFVDFAKR